jgi:hypothetical protein
MAATKIAIHVQSDSAILEEQVIMLGEAYLKKWKIAANQTVTLVFGSYKKEVQVIPVDRLAGLRLHASLTDLLKSLEDANRPVGQQE